MPAALTSGLDGTVTDGRGAPIAGAVVALTRNGRGGAPAIGPRRSAATAVSAADGRFRMDSLAAGEYGLTATAAGYLPAALGPVPLPAGETSTVVLVLRPGGVAMTGEVADAGGGPVPGAVVRAVAVLRSPVAAPPLYETVVDSAGGYRMGLAPGFYDIVVEADGYVPVRIASRIERDQARDFRLVPAGVLEGRAVERGSGSPVDGATVWLTADGEEGLDLDRDVTTGADGTFAVADLPAGTFVVSARRGDLIGSSAAISLAPMGTVAVEVVMDRGLSVRGRVVSANREPIDGAVLSISRRERPFDGGATTTSGIDGSFTLEGLRAGRHSLLAAAEGFVPGSRDLTLAGADGGEVLVSLSEESRVTGSVVTREGRPAASAEVVLSIDEAGPDGARGTSTHRATTDRDGRFALRGLGPGRMTVSALHPDHGTGREATFSLAPGEERTVTLEIEPRPDDASITGTVRTADGKPAAGALVVATLVDAVGVHQAQEVSGEDGAYRVSGLAAGRVEISALLADSTSSPRALHLRDGEGRQGVDLELPGRGLSIAGRVLDAGGQPVDGASVRVTPERGGSAARVGDGRSSTLTDVDGSFRIEDLGAGTYTLLAFHSDHPQGRLSGVEAGRRDVSLHLPTGAKLSGTVVDAGGAAVADFKIVLVRSAPGGLEVGPTHDARLVRDPAGAFSFERLEAGTYQLRVAARAGGSGAAQVTLRPGESAVGVRVTVSDDRALEGVVLDADTGLAVAGATVHVALHGEPVPGSTVTTDARGVFTLGVTAGSSVLRLTIGRDGYVPEARDVAVPVGGRVQPLRIRLLRGSLDERMAETGSAGLDVSVREDGPVVAAVRPGGPAELAGIAPGDRIVSIAGHDARELGPLSIGHLLAGPPGATVALVVQAAQGAARVLTLVLVARRGPE